MANVTRKPMRQGQQNRRGRGRGRKVQNPLGRNLESNGPDVKIRGNAAHIAEKYVMLARDALASGNMVAGESYLQHAEHYNRIILANQAQQPAPHGENMNGANAGRGRNSAPGEDTKGKQPEVSADEIGTNPSTGSAPGQNTDVEKPAKPVAKGGNGADDAGKPGSVAGSKKEEASDGGDSDEKPDEAVT